MSKYFTFKIFIILFFGIPLISIFVGVSQLPQIITYTYLGIFAIYSFIFFAKSAGEDEAIYIQVKKDLIKLAELENKKQEGEY